VSLAEALEAAASALTEDAEAIWPANGDPAQLLRSLEADGAVRVVRWLLAERPGDSGELTEVWSESDTGVAALLAVDEAGLPKPGRKELRRVLHRLRSRGVTVERAAPAPRVAHIARVEEELEAALLSPLDPAGGRVAYLMEAHPSGGARIFEVLLDDGRGVLSLEVYSASRSKARRFFRELVQRDRFPAIEVEVDEMRAVVAHAADAQVADRPLPRGFGEWRGRIARPRGDGMLPGARAADALAGTEGSLDDAVKLVEQGRVGPWPPDQKVLMALVERLRTAADSPLIVSGDTKRGQLDDLVADAAEEIFDAAGRALAAHRFRESAFCLWRVEDEDAARACLAAAASLSDESAPVRDNPVARALLTIPLQPILEAGAPAEPAGEPTEEEGESPILMP
jgi:hypothetical protein